MKKLLLSISLLFVTLVNAQLIVDNTTQTPAQLVQNVLLGSGISVSNVTFNGSASNATMVRDQVGHFLNGSATNIGLNNGIILSTGKATVAIGPNDTSGKTSPSIYPMTGDADLGAIASASINTKAIIEFDFVPIGQNLSFSFVFGSEEYLEFVNAGFNDVFGFFLSGPGIVGPYTGGATNIALVPATTTPISIDNVNNVSNSTFYVNNGNGSTPTLNPTIQFDGFTTVLTANSTVQCGETYHIKIAIANVGDSSLDSAVFLQAGSFSSSSCSPIELVSFLDLNSNGVKESNEINFTNGNFVYQKNGGVPNYINSPTGTYSIYDANLSNVYDFSFQVNPQFSSYFSSGTTSYSGISISPLGTQTLYFPITQTLPFEDISVSIIPIEQPRPGFNYTNAIELKNTGATTYSGTLDFVKSPQVAITNVTETTTTTPTGFSHSFLNLLPGEARTIYVTMSVPSIPTVNLGNILSNSATTTVPTSDIITTNNSFSNSQIVVGAYDPNDKMESHGDKIQFNQFAANDYLFYTIRFQNEGTADAINVRIEDVLNSKIDETSVQMISASHIYTMQRTSNNLIWNFNDIYLQPMSIDEEMSKGYVTFKAKLKPGFAIGDVIPNTANIYFDSNPAIVTNTFNTEFVAALGNSTFDSGNFVLVPNPASDFVQIYLLNNSESIKSIVINDVLGKTIKSIENVNSNQTQVNTSEFSQGIYMIEITTNNELKQVNKLIVN
ncbi:choice-of-anchor L domain-containing protein [Flavobacterium koreense]